MPEAAQYQTTRCLCAIWAVDPNRKVCVTFIIGFPDWHKMLPDANQSLHVIRDQQDQRTTPYLLQQVRWTWWVLTSRSMCSTTSRGQILQPTAYFLVYSRGTIVPPDDKTFMCDTSGWSRQEGMYYIYCRFSWSAQDATRCELIAAHHMRPTRLEDHTLPSATSTSGLYDVVGADFQEHVVNDIERLHTATYGILPDIFQRHHSTTGQQDIYVRYERLTQTGRYVLYSLSVFLISARCYQMQTNHYMSYATNKIRGPCLAFCNKYVGFVWHGGCWLPGVCVRRHQGATYVL